MVSVRWLGCLCLFLPAAVRGYRSAAVWQTRRNFRLDALPEDSGLQLDRPELSKGAAFATLNAVTALWGTQHAVIKTAVISDAIDPAAVNFVRFGIACLALLPWLPRGDAADFAASAEGVLEPEKTSLEPEKTSLEPEKTSLEGQWKAAAELGLWMFLGYALQAVGLQYTTASRSCFLLYLNVKIVPLLSAFVFKRSVAIDTWISAAIAVFGTFLLSFDGGPPNIGDFWSLLAAVASAFFILRLDTHINKFASSLSLTAALSFTTTVYCLMWAVVDIVASGGLVAETSQLGTLSQSLAKEIADVATASPSEMLYLGLVATALTSVLQAFGQSKIPPEDAALIYALDPVWGAGFAYLLLGEQLGPEGFVGAGLITAAAIGSQLLGRDETKAKADAA